MIDDRVDARSRGARTNEPRPTRAFALGGARQGAPGRLFAYRQVRGFRLDRYYWLRAYDDGFSVPERHAPRFRPPNVRPLVRFSTHALPSSPHFRSLPRRAASCRRCVFLRAFPCSVLRFFRCGRASAEPPDGREAFERFDGLATVRSVDALGPFERIRLGAPCGRRPRTSSRRCGFAAARLFRKRSGTRGRPYGRHADACFRGAGVGRTGVPGRIAPSHLRSASARLSRPPDRVAGDEQIRPHSGGCEARGRSLRRLERLFRLSHARCGLIVACDAQNPAGFGPRTCGRGLGRRARGRRPLRDDCGPENGPCGRREFAVLSLVDSGARRNRERHLLPRALSRETPLHGRFGPFRRRAGATQRNRRGVPQNL